MDKVLVLLILAAFLAGACTAVTEYRRTASYEGQMVVRCSGLEQERKQIVLNHDLIDVWKINLDGNYVDIRVNNDLYNQMKERFPECIVLHPSVETLVREAEMEMEKVKLNATWHEEYHSYDDIVSWYKELAEKFNDIVMYIPSIGKSYEGRDQPAVHITTNTKSDKFKIYFQCQIHAREWISGATCMYIAEELVKKSKNAEVAKLLESLEFIFVPFVNPDGYEYTWTNDRLWRKNRRPGSLCDGVDLNRNYDDHWGGGGSSGNECSETYRGKGAASEPETENTQNYFIANKPIIGAIDWHSYSQLILRPYGWTEKDCPDEDQLKGIGDEMATAIESVHGKQYTSIKSIGLYPTTGTASDWFYSDDVAKENGGYRAAGYTIELRDTGRYGFELPPDEIIPTGEENFAAVIIFAQSLLDNPIIYNVE